MEIDRRDFGKATLLTATSMGLSMFSATSSRAQTAPVRLPLHEFVSDSNRLATLRRGVRAMKERKPSDPLSWTFQAAIHGYTEDMLKEWEKEDPEVAKVNHEKYWNQCPHFGQNSANFLPWHRAYTFHFETILRMHTGDSDFALPYWDYSIEAQRTFPRDFGIEHLDGDANNNDPSNINSLFHRQRDFFLCGYEHPFTDQLPLVDLSKRATDASRAMKTPVFFGDDEASGLGGGVYDEDTSTRGLLEQAPHDQIHRAVGGQVAGITFPDGGGNPIQGTSVGGMAIPMTAGYDPIFCVHHSNIDRLWTHWSCMMGKSWGILPDKSWFHEKPWFFFDEAGHEVNRPRKDYFDHRSLGVRFKDEDLSCDPLQLPPEILVEDVVMAASSKNQLGVSTVSTLENRERIALTPQTAASVDLVGSSDFLGDRVAEFVAKSVERADQAKKIQILIDDVELGKFTKSGYDVYLVSSSTDATSLSIEHPGYLGSISLFVHAMNTEMKFNQLFDATKVWKDAASDLEGFKVVLAPYALTTDPKIKDLPLEFGTRELSAGGISLKFVE